MQAEISSLNQRISSNVDSTQVDALSMQVDVLRQRLLLLEQKLLKTPIPEGSSAKSVDARELADLRTSLASQVQMLQDSIKEAKSEAVEEMGRKGDEVEQKYLVIQERLSVIEPSVSALTYSTDKHQKTMTQIQQDLKRLMPEFDALKDSANQNFENLDEVMDQLQQKVESSQASSKACRD